MEPGKALISIGALILAVGLAINYAPWLVSWFGKLPGDIRIQNKNSFVFIPITSMIVVSLLITVLANLFFRK
ncbi:DUF2905 domain-containing protein [Methylomonas sp. SURF-1]|uniref:DUF2905 domain-containing protein n=1 Tax=Methylomonas aurea TaxID=2952224 RepID=A0ABT1UER0_9GAMM|nr:DUF2905 domain-containing protein [Methylomonas sp. SURF-1]MCQ8180185.1 DUF2905 domain-containing protein [Methylomonas sp. SURF-1]